MNCLTSDRSGYGNLLWFPIFSVRDSRLVQVEKQISNKALQRLFHAATLRKDKSISESLSVSVKSSFCRITNESTHASGIDLSNLLVQQWKISVLAASGDFSA
jgi:hypothetical protein